MGPPAKIPLTNSGRIETQLSRMRRSRFQDRHPGSVSARAYNRIVRFDSGGARGPGEGLRNGEKPGTFGEQKRSGYNNHNCIVLSFGMACHSEAALTFLRIRPTEILEEEPA